MKLYEFNRLPREQQLAAVLVLGCHLAGRWADGCSVKLHHMPSNYFVELYYDMYNNRLVRLRSFTCAAPLEDYAVSVRLPEDWT